MRLLRFSFSLSLSLSEEQTKARKVYENSLAFKKLSFSQSSCFPLSVLFHFSLFTHKNKKKAAFWSIQIALTKRFLYLIESHFFFSVACSLAIARESIGRKTHARTVTHTHARTHTHRASSYHGASDALAHPDELLSGFGRGE